MKRKVCTQCLLQERVLLEKSFVNTLATPHPHIDTGGIFGDNAGKGEAKIK